MSGTEAFVYLVDADELPRLFFGWPKQMRLAVCLDARGRCEIVPFHASESRAVAQRAAQVLGRTTAEIAVVPEMAGQPVRRLLFSEENDILAMLRGTDGVLDLAADYALNFAFAAERGLDLKRLMEPGPHANRAPVGVAGKGVPEDDVCAAGDARKITARLFRRGGRVRVATGPRADNEQLPDFVRKVALRDDLAAYFIPRGALPSNWTPWNGLMIDAPAEVFPSGFADTPRDAIVTITPEGLFVEPQASPALPPRPTPSPASSRAPADRHERGPVRRRRGARAGLAALAFCATTGVVAVVAQTVTHVTATGTPPTLAVFDIAPSDRR